MKRKGNEVSHVVRASRVSWGRLVVATALVTACAVGVSGCGSSADPDSQDSAAAASSTPSEAAAEGTAGAEAEPTLTEEPAPGSADEWCQTVYTSSGLTDFAAQVRAGVTADLEPVGSSSYATLDRGAMIVCDGFDAIVSAARFVSADAAAAGRADAADVHIGPPATVGGVEGEYVYTDPASGGILGGGVSFTWQTDLSDFSATILVGPDATTDEAGLRRALEGVIRVAMATRLPGDGDFCAMAPDVYATTIDDGSRDLGVFNEDGIEDLAVYLRTVAEECGPALAEELIASHEDAFSGGGFEMLQEEYAG